MWLFLINLDGAGWLNTILFCVLKAVYGLLATSDSIWYQIYSYHDIGNQRMAKQALEKAVNQR